MVNANPTTTRPPYDKLLVDIADYVDSFPISRPEAYRVARYCAIDALGCAFDALSYPDCTKLLGPLWPGVKVPNGSRVPGTRYELDPVTAAFNLGTMIRWTDFNDTFYAADAGHPSDNLGGILAVADSLSRIRVAEGKAPLTMRDVLTALIKVYEIKGGICICNNFAKIGLDHPTLSRVASAAVLTKMLGGGHQEIMNAVSNAWADGFSLKLIRQAPNIGSRKCWAGGDATSRGVFHAILATRGEMGYPSVLTDPTWGLYKVLYHGKSFQFDREFGSFVIENVMFKFAAAGTHGQTAFECSLKLHPQAKNRIDDIETITMWTQEKMLGIMNKTGPLHNPADRDHCAQYIVAVGLIHGKIDSASYEDEFAADPRIDALRYKTKLIEDERYTRDQLDLKKLSNASAIQIKFKDGSTTEKVEVEYPLGHPRRYAEAMPMLEQKFRQNIAKCFSPQAQEKILELCLSQEKFESTPVPQFVDRLVC